MRCFALNPDRPRVGGTNMRDDSVEQLRTELVNLLQRQVEALELETYVGLTGAELREFYERQERIRDLKAGLGPPSLRLPCD